METDCNRHFPLFRNVKKVPTLFPGILFQRQLEALSETCFRSRILKSKLQNLRCSEMTLSQFLDVYYGSALSVDGACQLITPCDVFLGAWTTGKYPHKTLFIDVFYPDLVINEYGMEERLRHANVMRNCQIVDMCDVESEGIHFTSYIAYSLDSGTTHFQVVPRRDHTTMHDRSIELRAMRLEFNSIRLYNCIWNSFSQTLALGSNLGVINYSGLDGLGSPANDPWVFGNERRFTSPYCQDFDQKGCLLYLGFGDGVVGCGDRRCPDDNFAGEIHVGRNISHIKLLSDERSLIVSASEDKLCYVDTRMNSVLFTYPSHQSKHRKVPFCTEESLDVICSSGEDYITRYWSLKGGKLLAEFHPPNNPPDDNTYMYSSIRDTGSGIRSHIFLGNEIHCLEPQL